MNSLKIVIILMFVCFSAGAMAQQKPPGNVDCRASVLKKAELKFQELAKPLLTTYAEQYSGRIEVLEEKEEKRAKLFREWLQMRCICQPKGMSLFEKTLCHALGEGKPIVGRKACLVRN